MAMIPMPIYRLVERRLREQADIVRRAEERAETARQRAGDPSVRPAEKEPSGQHPREDPRLQAVLEADEALAMARRWGEVFRRVDQAFPPGSNTRCVADLLYREGLSQEEACRRLGRDRQFVRRQRDIYVCHCAVIAAAAGLIRLKINTQEDARK